jgi:NTE family protein
VSETTSDVEATSAERYQPRRERRGIGICLSGGGFRATLFHLGALRRLNELGVLAHAEMRTISSVSGGSITAAMLATAMVRHADWSERWTDVVERPLREFTRRNIRTGPLLRGMLPWKTVVGELAEQYEKRLTPLKLRELPSRPEFVLCSTDMAFGVNWGFRRATVGDYQLGLADTPADWPLAKAVAASSCFPPIFQPMRVPVRGMDFRGGKARETDPEKWHEAVRDLRLTDGGNYDNMGTEPVWKDHAVVIVSDAGGLFDLRSDQSLLWRIGRYAAILENQARSLRKRWLVSNFITRVMNGTYFGVGSARSRYERGDTLGYSKELAARVIAEIRTDLDAFSDPEAAVLMNHGYLLADKAVRTHVDPRWWTAKELRPPYPEWLPPDRQEAAIREALRGSERRKNLGRS